MSYYSVPIGAGKLLRAGLGVALIVLLFIVFSPVAPASANYGQFCWGVKLAGQDQWGGNPQNSLCDSYDHNGMAGYIDEVGGSGEQHSVCVLAWWKEGSVQCSAGPNQGVYNFTPEGKIQSVGQIDNNAQGENKVYAFMVTCNGPCTPLEEGGGGGGESPPPEQFSGFQSNGNVMWDYSSANGAFDTSSGMAAKTSPSVAYVPGTGYLMAFQGSDSNLWIYNRAANSWINTKLGMASGTSPSIAVNSNGTYDVAFQANSGALWYYSSATNTGTNTTGGMAAGTSPSLTWTPGNGYVAAFQASSNVLWSYNISSGGWTNTKLAMSPGTSPSIAGTGSSAYVIAINAVEHYLWTYSSNGFFSNRGLGLASGTSPSVAADNDYSGNGSYIVAFQANTGSMWYFSSSQNGGIDTKSGMAPETSPSADFLEQGGYVLSFQANTTYLWTFRTSSGNWNNTGLGMASGTSPSIIVH